MRSYRSGECRRVDLWAALTYGIIAVTTVCWSHEERSICSVKVARDAFHHSSKTSD